MIDIKVLINERSELSVRKQCDLLGLPRSSYYYSPKGEPQENLEIMSTMDKHILEEPTAGVLTIAVNAEGYRDTCLLRAR